MSVRILKGSGSNLLVTTSLLLEGQILVEAIKLVSSISTHWDVFKLLLRLLKILSGAVDQNAIVAGDAPHPNLGSWTLDPWNLGPGPPVKRWKHVRAQKLSSFPLS